MTDNISPPFSEIADLFADAVQPANFPDTLLRFRNARAAVSVGLDDLSTDAWTRHFGEFVPLPGNLPEPLAMRYHGHQFGTYNPQLGDGRGFLFAQVQNAQGHWYDLGTKGSGQTPWSRAGDGRLTLKGGVREVLASAYLEAHGVKTSKTLSLIETGEQLARSDEPSPARSAVMVRLSETHIRLGTFQRVAFLDDKAALAKLVEHCATHYHPDAHDPDMSRQAAALLELVSVSVANMIAQWMATGFVHGVMNTDNFNITGETFDFGPYRFLPFSDPNFVAAYFDEKGLYRFGRQPAQGLWALQKFAGALSYIADAEPLGEALEAYEPAYQRSFARHTLALLGLNDGPSFEDDLRFLQAFYRWLTESGASWAQTFFDWFGGEASAARAAESPARIRYEEAAFNPVREGLYARQARAPEQLEHAYFSSPSPATLLIDDVETLWAAIADQDNWAPFEDKLAQIEQARCALALPVPAYSAGERTSDAGSPP